MSGHRRSALGTAGLFRRAVAAGPAPAVLLAVLVATTAFLAVLVPRAVEALHTAALQTELAAETPYALDLTTQFIQRPDLGAPAEPTTLAPDVDAVWGEQEERLVALRDDLPDPLRGILDDPQVVLVSGPARALAEGAPTTGRHDLIQPGVDPRMREHLRLVDGTWPAPLEGDPPTVPDLSDRAGRVAPITDPVEIVMATAVAEAMHWPVGEHRTADLGGTGSLPVVLVGTVEAVDPGDGYWTHAPTAIDPSIIDNGIAPPQATGVAFIDPADWEHLETQPLPSTASAWYPIAIDRIESRDLDALTTQLFEVQSTVVVLGDDPWTSGYPPLAEVGFTSGLRELLQDQAARQGAVDAVLATVLAGPVGVVVAVLVLGAGVLFERRRIGHELAAARGASDRRLRGLLAAEGLAIGLPAAILGGIAAIAATPGTTALGGWAAAALFAVTPALLLAGSASSLSPLRRARADLGGAGGRFRWVWESIVLLLTALAVGLLVLRELDDDSPSAASGIDPLLAAVPVLIALTGCVVVLRVYPVPLAAVLRRARPGRGLVPFLGAARALRDPAAGVVPVLAVVVGVAVAVCSSVILGTVHAGTERAAAARVGADAILRSAPLTREQQAAIDEVPGVATTAAVYSTASVGLEVDGVHETTTLIVVDVADVRAAQAGSPEALPLPESLTGGADGPTPVVVSTVIEGRFDGAADIEMEGEPIAVVGVVDGRTPFSPRSAWILMDVSEAEPFTDTLVPDQVLVRFEPGADDRAAIEAIRTIAGTDAVVETPDASAAEVAALPATRGLTVALIATIVLTSLLTALALVLTLLVGRPARARLMPLLSTLGLDRGGARRLVFWEIAPVTAVAVVVGTALGILMPYVTLAGIDLTAFTTGDRQPTITVDVPLLLLVLGGSIVIASLAAVLAAASVQRIGAAGALRKEED